MPSNHVELKISAICAVKRVSVMSLWCKSCEKKHGRAFKRMSKFGMCFIFQSRCHNYLKHADSHTLLQNTHLLFGINTKGYWKSCYMRCLKDYELEQNGDLESSCTTNFNGLYLFFFLYQNMFYFIKISLIVNDIFKQWISIMM